MDERILSFMSGMA
jgi:DNA-binding transcriptional ArsR family regulator